MGHWRWAGTPGGGWGMPGGGAAWGRAHFALGKLVSGRSKALKGGMVGARLGLRVHLTRPLTVSAIHGVLVGGGCAEGTALAAQLQPPDP